MAAGGVAAGGVGAVVVVVDPDEVFEPDEVDEPEDVVVLLAGGGAGGGGAGGGGGGGSFAGGTPAGVVEGVGAVAASLPAPPPQPAMAALTLTMAIQLLRKFSRCERRARASRAMEDFNFKVDLFDWRDDSGLERIQYFGRDRDAFV